MIRIVDGNNKLHRSFYEQQQNIGVHPLRELYLQFISPINNTFVVWDGPYSKARRQAIYPAYKANRAPPSEDTTAAFDIMKAVLLHCPVTQIEIPEWEADDVIATLARKFTNELGEKVVIDSNDGDFWQLHDGENINVPILANKKISYLPKYTCMVKALVGDTSDNIPGWKGFGIATLMKMSHVFDELERCLQDEDYDAWQQLPWPSKRFEPTTETFYYCCTYYRLITMLEVPEEDFEGNVVQGLSEPAKVEEIFHPLHI